MTNLLNDIMMNKPKVNTPKQPAVSSFNADTNGKIKPLPDKAKLQPSRIFGSPKEYVKDIKKDILVIGKATKGKERVNDHELGRINDLAMKVGSLSLAAYLCVKNRGGNLRKAMEFVGFGTFFGAMALWPKLAIQAPIKARTGVDIHQKYIDSQDRKKMLFQDPQYDLTDMYSREDLDRMGKKLGVDENLPDRDNFIKQRAKKTAVQGNTLWMLTAGFATPLMSALGCNVLEKPIQSGINKIKLNASDRSLKKLDNIIEGKPDNFVSKICNKVGNKIGGKFGDKIKNFHSSDKLKDIGFEQFLRENADKKLDKVAEQLSNKIQTDGIINNSVTETLKKMATGETRKAPVTMDEIKEIFENADTLIKTKDGKRIQLSEFFKGLSQEQLQEINTVISDEKLNTASSVSMKVKEFMEKTGNFKIGDRDRAAKSVKAKIDNLISTPEQFTVGDKKDEIKKLYEAYKPVRKGLNIIDKHRLARTAPSIDAGQCSFWQKTSDDFLNCLKFSSNELKKISVADADTEEAYKLISDRLTKIVSDDKQYEKTIKKISQNIAKFQAEISNPTKDLLDNKMNGFLEKAGKSLKAEGFDDIAQRVWGNAAEGTWGRNLQKHAAEGVRAYEVPFYRLLTTLETFKDINNGTFEEKLTKELQNKDPKRIKELIETSKKILLKATATDHTEKLKNRGYNIDADEYKAIMKVIFGSDTKIEFPTTPVRNGFKNIKDGLGFKYIDDGFEKVKGGFEKYKADFMNKVGNYSSDVTPALKRTVINGETKSMDGLDRSQLVGASVMRVVKSQAGAKHNTNKWLKIFGLSFAVLTAATLLIGTQLGKKTKAEKIAEKEGKAND